VCRELYCAYKFIFNTGEILFKTKAKAIFVLWQYKDLVPFGEIFLKFNITTKIFMGYIASPLVQIPHLSDVYQGSFDFEVNTGFVEGLHDFISSLKPQTVVKTMFQLQKSSTSPPITKIIKNKKIIFSSANPICFENTSTDFENLRDVFPVRVASFENDQQEKFTGNSHLIHLNNMMQSQQIINHSNNFACISSITSRNCTFLSNWDCSNVNFLKQYGMLGRKTNKTIHKKLLYANLILQESLHHSKLHLGSFDDFLFEVWENIFHCSWKPTSEGLKHCTGSESLENVDTQLTDVSQLRYGYRAYLAVYAIAHSLHNLFTCVPDHGPFTNGSCVEGNFHSWQVSFLYCFGSNLQYLIVIHLSHIFKCSGQNILPSYNILSRQTASL